MDSFKTIENLKYIRPRGEGYFSVVSEYADPNTNLRFAVKTLKVSFKDNPDYRHRFEREVELLRQLSGHENIIEVLGRGTKNDRPYYVMQAADENLEEYIKKNNRLLNVHQRTALFDAVIEAIEYAHSKDILHRDISPRNVLIFRSQNGVVVKVSDFGLGKKWTDDSGFTRSQIRDYGQRDYVAPEQVEKLNNATIQSDIFSLGKLLDFVLTGKKPIVVNSKGGWKSLVEKATKSDPSERFKSLSYFKRKYEDVKELLLPDEDKDLTMYSENGFLGSDNKTDFRKFHHFAVVGPHFGQIYKDYIKVVLDFLNDEDNLRTYVFEFNDDLTPFVETFTQRLEELPSTGWPFTAINDAAYILAAIFRNTSDQETKFLCLSILWKYAFQWDRWTAQKILRNLFENKQIPENLFEEFALYIVETDFVPKRDAFEGVTVPHVIQRAIVTKMRKA